MNQTNKNAVITWKGIMGTLPATILIVKHV
jgi:hypothetical protein